MGIGGDNWLVEDNEIYRLKCSDTGCFIDADYVTFSGNNLTFRGNSISGAKDIS